MSRFFKSSDPRDIIRRESTFISQEPKEKPAYLLPRTTRTTGDDLEFVDLKLLPGKVIPKPTKVILVVGETGSGKSMFINGMVNFILGVQRSDNFRFKLTHETKAAEKARSVTKKVTVYTIHHEDFFRVHHTIQVIDTPGFADTEGFDKDEGITSCIQRLFKHKGDGGIDHIDCIGLVAQADKPRITTEQKYVFQRVASLFAKDIKDNIVLLLTFASPTDVNPLSLDTIRAAKIPFVKYFKFNNSALFLKISSQLEKSYWKMGKRSFEVFFGDLENALKPKSLLLSIEVLDERQHLASLLDTIIQEVRSDLDRSEAITHEQNAINQYLVNVSNNSYTAITSESYKEPIPDGQYITNCKVCLFTCHEDCKIKDNSIKFNCVAIDNNDEFCLRCPKKCIWSVHRNDNFKWVHNVVETTESSAALIARMQSSGYRSENEMLAAMQQKYTDNQKEVFSKTERARQCINRLREIALKPDHLSAVDYINILIGHEQNGHEPGWEARVKHLEFIIKKMEYLDNM